MTNVWCGRMCRHLEQISANDVKCKMLNLIKVEQLHYLPASFHIKIFYVLPKECIYLFIFLGAFANLRKTTISFVLSCLCPSVRMEQLGSCWTDFY